MQVTISEDRNDGKLRVHVEGEPENDAEAIDNSIAKWTLMLKVSEEEHRPVHSGGTSTCALCMLHWYKNCRGCPIEQKTGMWECRDTPYERYCATSDRLHLKEAPHVA